MLQRQEGTRNFGFWILGFSVEQIANMEAFFVNEEYFVLAGSFIVGIFASIVPAALAYNSDISETLSRA